MLVDRREQKSRIGDIVEHKAVVWLLESGFEVFKNVSCIGPIDLIVLDSKGNVIKVDVKKCTDASRNEDKITHQRKSEEQKNLNVRFLYYDETRDYFGWSIEEIYNNAGKPYRKVTTAQSKKERVEIHLDKSHMMEFQSTVAMCNHFGVSERSFRNRRTLHPDESIKKSMEEVIHKSKVVWVFQNRFPNRKEACRYYKVNPNSVEERMRVKGIDLESTIQHFIDRNARRR